MLHLTIIIRNKNSKKSWKKFLIKKDFRNNFHFYRKNVHLRVKNQIESTTKIERIDHLTSQALPLTLSKTQFSVKTDFFVKKYQKPSKRFVWSRQKVFYFDILKVVLGVLTQNFSHQSIELALRPLSWTELVIIYDSYLSS